MGPSKCMSTTKGIQMGYGEEKGNCIDPKAGDADLWYEFWWKWSMSKRTSQRRTRQRCRNLIKFVTEGNVKADELAKAGAMLDEGLLAETRAKTVQQEREEVYVPLQYAASFHCVVQEWKDCAELKPKPEEKWIFVDQEKRGDETSEANKVPMHEVWEKQQTHENERKKHKAK